VKITEIEQEELGAMALFAQVLEALVKSAELLPAMVTVEMCRVALPELVTVVLMGPLVAPWVMVGKLTGFGAMVTAGAGGGGATAVPVSETE